MQVEVDTLVGYIKYDRRILTPFDGEERQADCRPHREDFIKSEIKYLTV